MFAQLFLSENETSKRKIKKGHANIRKPCKWCSVQTTTYLILIQIVCFDLIRSENVKECIGKLIKF